MKKVIYFLLVFTMIISISNPVNIYGQSNDYDNHWASNILNKWVYDKQYIEGYSDGTLRPDKEITRAEFAKIINKIFNYSSPDIIVFNDVETNSWYFNDIAVAVNAGYIKGISPNEFKPDDKLTREQAAVIITRIRNLEYDEESTNMFTDKTEISNWAIGSVGAATKAGYLKGYNDNSFKPQNFTTRAEAIVMLDRIIEMPASPVDSVNDAKNNNKHKVNKGQSENLKATSLKVLGNDKIQPRSDIYEYTAVVSDQNNNLMSNEEIIWSVTTMSGISYSIKGDKLYLTVDNLPKKTQNENNETSKLKSDISNLSITEEREANICLEVEDGTDIADIQWTINGKSFDSYKKWVEADESYNGNPWISFSIAPEKNGNLVVATIQFDLPLDTTDPSFPRITREEISKLMETYELEAKNSKTNQIETFNFKLKPYDSFVKYQDLKNVLEDKINESYNISISAKVSSNKSVESNKNTSIVPNLRYKEIKSIGKSYENNDVYFGVIAKNKEAVDNYQQNIMPLALETPEQLIDLIKNNKFGEYQVPIIFSTPHPDESPAVDGIIKLFSIFATENKFEFNDKDGSKVTLDIDYLLDNFIFLFNFTENPDGRMKFIRDTVNDIDLNRDMAVQQAVESRIFAEEYIKWNPLILWDFHGFYEDKFYITPGTQPYDPNMENDMILYSAIEDGYSFGDILKANTQNDYVLVKDLYSYENTGFFGLWDAATPSFIETYAMLHGALGHNAEVQSLNEASVDGLIYGSFGSIKYALDNKDTLFLNQLEIFRRGVNGEDNIAVDQAILDEKEEPEGRQRSNDDNFFPEYYVIPVDQAIQKNSLEAYNVAEYLMRNGVKLERLTQEVMYNGKKYPIGSFVVNMHQAKRGFANSVLYSGLRYEKDKGLQAIAVVDLPDMNGFNIYEVREKNLFNGKTENLGLINVPTTILPQQTENYVLKNINNDTIRAVNKLLDIGEKVQMVTKVVTSGAIVAGDFVVSDDSIKKVYDSYLLDLIPYNEDDSIKGIELKTIRKPNISFMKSPRYNFTLNVLNELGFEVKEVYPEDIDLTTDVVIDDYGSFEVSDDVDCLKNNGIDLITLSYDGFNYGARKVIGSSAASVKDIKNPTYWQGIMKVNLNRNSAITARYDNYEYFYLDQGRYFSKVPENSTVLYSISNDDDIFKSGQFTNLNEIKGKTMAFKTSVTTPENKCQVTVFLNWFTKWYGRNMYGLLANSIYESAIE